MKFNFKENSIKVRINVDKNINYKLERQLDKIQKEMKSNDR